MPTTILLPRVPGMSVAFCRNVRPGRYRGEVRSRDTELGHDPGPNDLQYAGPERRWDAPTVEVEPVRLTRKYAEAIDGIDLSQREVGDRLPLPSRDARMLVAEGWAEPVAGEEQRRAAS